MVKISLLTGTLLFAGLAIISLEAVSGQKQKKAEWKQSTPPLSTTSAIVPSPAPVIALARKWMPNSLCNLLLPLRQTVPNPNSSRPEGVQLIVTDLYYGGSTTDATHARLLAVAIPQSDAGIPLKQLLAQDDLASPLSRVGERVLDRLSRERNSPNWVSVMWINATWQPWRLELTVQDAVVSAHPGATVPPYLLTVLNDKRNPFKLTEINTGRVLLPLDQGSSLEMRAAFGFKTDAITIALLPVAVASAMPMPGSQGYDVSLSNVPEEASSVLLVPFSFINYVFETTYMNKSIIVGKTQDAKEVRLMSPRIASEDNGLKVIADVDPQPLVANMSPPRNDQRITFQVNYVGMPQEGGDLRFEKSEIKKIECGSLSLANCLGFRTGIGVANGRFNQSNAANNEQGKAASLLRTESVINLGQLLLAERAVKVSALTLRTHKNQSALAISGHITLEK